LRDLVSYNEKHNTVNGENNRDGNNANWSWNSGAEGITDDASISENRRIRARAMITTLLMSFGTPMLVGGDEFGNTQFGNNNPYCQDNVITWIVWEAINKQDKDFVRYVRRVINLRKKMKIFTRSKFFNGKVIEKYARYKIKDIMWLTNDGKEFTNNDWYLEKRHSLASFIYGGENKSYLIIYNASSNSENWQLPSFCKKAEVSLLLDSSETIMTDVKFNMTDKFSVPAWSVMVLDIKKGK